LKPVSGLRRLLDDESGAALRAGRIFSEIPSAEGYPLCDPSACSLSALWISSNFAHISASFFAALLIAWACKSFSFSPGLPFRWQFTWPPTPTPYVDPISPKVTHCHPRFGRGSQPVKAARRRSAAPQTVIVSERL
jgi:hypothetical protein